MNVLKVFNKGLIIETAGLLWKYERTTHIFLESEPISSIYSRNKIKNNLIKSLHTIT